MEYTPNIYNNVAYDVFHLRGVVLGVQNMIQYCNPKHSVDLTHPETNPDTYTGSSRHLISFNFTPYVKVFEKMSRAINRGSVHIHLLSRDTASVSHPPNSTGGLGFNIKDQG